MSLFANRVQAGQKLASALKNMGRNAIVLAIPRGGVVVGYEVARSLHVPLDVIITRKIGAPGNPELAIGAVAEDGSYILDDGLVEMLSVSKAYVESEVERQKTEIRRRLQKYRGDAAAPLLAKRDVVVVDDGVATGSTLKAALLSLTKVGAKSVTVAVPVGPADTVKMLKRLADNVVCLSTPEPFYAIGEFYADFDQTSDEEVTDLLARNRKELRG
ncbi:MAG TPA: phosphoribosyltransferase family protein [Candidatus Nanoarchaeia archaeon]|nr:phosphoribosyltransferase family protein [Candidatus Nanoarchaeia archaeon]